MANEPNINPRWADDVPWCVEACQQHDGKRCRVLGSSPGPICEPAVIKLSKQADLKIIENPRDEASKLQARIRALEEVLQEAIEHLQHDRECRWTHMSIAHSHGYRGTPPDLDECTCYVARCMACLGDTDAK